MQKAFVGERGIGSASGKPLHYKNSIIHRVIPGFMLRERWPFLFGAYSCRLQKRAISQKRTALAASRFTAARRSATRISNFDTRRTAFSVLVNARAHNQQIVALNRIDACF